MTLDDKLEEVIEEMSWIDEALDALYHIRDTEEMIRNLHDRQTVLRYIRDRITRKLDEQAQKDQAELEREYWRSR